MGLLDTISPQQRTGLTGLLGIPADMLQAVVDYANKTGADGKTYNPPLSMLSNALGLPQVATTLDRASYGEPLTNIGKANVPLLRPETADAAMALAPGMVGAARKAGGLLSNPALADAIASAASPKYVPAMSGNLGMGRQRGALLIDDADAPINYWHGTSKEFDNFDPAMRGNVWGDEASKLGTFLTADKSEAAHFADQAVAAVGGQRRLIKANVDLDNPEIINADVLSRRTKEWLSTLPDDEREMQMATKAYESPDGGISHPLNYAIQQAAQKGKDGAVISLDDGTEWVVAFKNGSIKQIK